MVAPRRRHAHGAIERVGGGVGVGDGEGEGARALRPRPGGGGGEELAADAGAAVAGQHLDRVDHGDVAGAGREGDAGGRVVGAGEEVGLRALHARHDGEAGGADAGRRPRVRPSAPAAVAQGDAGGGRAAGEGRGRGGVERHRVDDGVAAGGEIGVEAVSPGRIMKRGVWSRRASRPPPRRVGAPGCRGSRRRRACRRRAPRRGSSSRPGRSILAAGQVLSIAA